VTGLIFIVVVAGAVALIQIVAGISKGRNPAPIESKDTAKELALYKKKARVAERNLHKIAGGTAGNDMVQAQVALDELDALENGQK
jgi:hypothetical protein